MDRHILEYKMPVQAPSTAPNLEQNPKSILADRNHLYHHRFPIEKSNDQNSLRVTFAKVANNKQSNLSSLTSVHPNVDPVPKTGTPNVQAKVKSSVHVATVASSNRAVLIQKTIVKNEGEQKPVQAIQPNPNRKQVGDNAASLVPVRRSELEKTLKQSPNTAKTIANWLVPGVSRNFKSGMTTAASSRTAAKRSVETIGSTEKESARSIDTPKRVLSYKSTQRMRKFIRTSSSSVVGSTKRTKSGKKLKRSKKSSANPDNEKDMAVIKPAPLDVEYVSELNKISQILRAVTTGTGSSNAGVHPPEQAMNSLGLQGTDLRQSGNHAWHRPLSGDELKQLLSSITRVVSLHQLPLNDPNSHPPAVSTGLPVAKYSATDSEDNNKPKNEGSHNVGISEEPTNATVSTSSSPRKTKKKKKRKVKKLSALLASSKQSESKSLKSKSRLASSLSIKSKPSMRNGKHKEKPAKRSTSRKPGSNGSSVSSLEKDPIKNAVFLRKYYEESTRLANKKSSDDLLPKNQPIAPEETSKPEDKNKTRKKVENIHSMKSPSKRSIPAINKMSSR